MAEASLRRRCLLTAGGVFLALAVLLSGCAEMGGGMQAHALSVTLTEAAVRLNRASTAQGSLEVHVVNRGAHRRSVAIAREGESGELYRTAEIPPGGAADVEMDLPAGRYLLYAETDGRREPGMAASLLVESSSGVGGAPSTMGGYY